LKTLFENLHRSYGFTTYNRIASELNRWINESMDQSEPIARLTPFQQIARLIPLSPQTAYISFALA